MRPGPFLQYLWKHSLAAALFADRIGRWTESPVKYWGWPAGLLHDLGKFAFHAVSPAQYTQVREKALSEGVP
jgi:HD-like signal output (HDOD) protein